MDLQELLNKISRNLSTEIVQFYDKFHLYTFDLLSHKNIDLNEPIVQGSEGTTILINSINAALNTTGIPITELSNQEVLTDLLKDALIVGESTYKTLFDNVGKKFINSYLFKIILEYIIDLDITKIGNLDLFDILPPGFKSKLNTFKGKISLSDYERQKMKSSILTLNNDFDASKLKFKHERSNETDEGFSILKKLQEAKEKNIQVLGKSYQAKKLDTEILTDEKIEPDSKKFYYFDYFGNSPVLGSDKLDQIKINLDRFNSIKSHIDLLMDLENLFYYISISKMLGLKTPISTETIIAIMKNFVKGSTFSSSKYHMSNPTSNFYGLSILSELNILKESKIDFVDFLDIEMFLESEIKHFIPSKSYLNYYTLLSLNLLEKSGISIMDKSDLLELQLNLNLSSIDLKSLPGELLYHITLIKLISREYEFNGKFYNFDFERLISPNGLINENITDSARVLLIFDLLNQREQFSTTNLLNSMLSNYEAFIEDFPQFNWRSDKLALKTELRMLFWLLITLLRY